MSKSSAPQRKYSLRIPVWFPFLVTLAITLSAVLIRNTLLDLERVKAQEDLETALESVQRTLISRVGARLAPLERMASRWEQLEDWGRREWEIDASLLYQAPYYQAIEWIDPVSRIRWVVPREENRDRLGQYVGFEARRRSALEAAQKSGRLTVSEPIDLHTGVRGFRVFVPLRRGGELRGFLSAVFDSHELLDATLADVAAEDAMAIVAQGTSLYERVQPEDEAGKHLARRVVVRVQNAEWEITLWPGAAELARSRTRLPNIVLASGLLLGLLVGAALYQAQAAERSARLLQEALGDLELEIHQRRSTEMALNTSEAHFRFVFENSPLPMSLLDSDATKILLLNHAALKAFDLSPAEAGQLRLADLVAEEDYPGLLARLRNGIHATPDIGTWKLRRKNGELLSAELHCQMIHYAGRNETLMIVRHYSSALPGPDIGVLPS